MSADNEGKIPWFHFLFFFDSVAFKIIYLWLFYLKCQ